MRPDVLRCGAGLAVLGLAAALTACGGGGSGATPPAGVTPAPGVTATPTPAPTGTPPPPATSSATVSVGSQAVTATLAPITAGISGTIAFPATSSGSASVTATLSASLPAGTPAVQSARRAPATIGASGITVLAYVSVTASSGVAFNATPAFTFPFGGSIGASIAPTSYIAIFDPGNAGLGWTTAAGPGTVAGSSLTFASVAAPISLVAGRTYVYALFTSAAPLKASNRVRFVTTLGTIDVVLRPDVAPQNVANFLRYVNRGAYDGSFIHRVIPGKVVQGGGYGLDGNGKIVAIPTDPPVANEFALHNTRGTLAAATISGQPNSATSQWFFNVVDNSATLDSQNGGFTVFGQIDLADAASLSVMDAIAALTVIDAGSPFDQIPVVNYGGGTIHPGNFVDVNAIVPLP